MYKITCLFFCMISFLHFASGQFSFGSSDYPRFKLAGSLGQLITGQGLSSMMGMNSGFGQILGSLISNAGSNSGGPLTQLATAASTQYMNAIRSSPLLSQFTGQSQQAPPPNQMPYSSHPHGPQHPQAMFNPMHNPMALLGADNSMYGPPQPGFDSHFGGSNVFPQFAAPENYFGGSPYGPSSHPMPVSPLYSGSSSYGSHMPAPIHHLDKK